MMNPQDLLKLFTPLVSGVCGETKDHATRAAVETVLHVATCEQCRAALLQTHEELPFLFKTMLSKEQLEAFLQLSIERADQWQQSQRLTIQPLSSNADATTNTQST